MIRDRTGSEGVSMRPRPWSRMVEAVLPLSGREREALAASIAARGVLDPIRVLPDGRIIDGHHRWELSNGGAPVQVVELDEDRAFALGLECNTARRQMTPEQWRETREPLRRRAVELRTEGLTQQQTADQLGVARRTIDKWESEGASIVTGDIACPPDLRVSVPRAEHPRIVERIDAGEPQAQVAADYGIARQRVGQIVALHRAAQLKSEPAVTPDAPDGRYRCVVIDPPWPVTNIQREERPNQGAHLPYPTLPVYCEDPEPSPCFALDDSAACQSIECKVGAILAQVANPDGCHIYLWVTHKYLPAGLELFDSWGVRYECSLTWQKPGGFTPLSWMYNTEHVLFGRIGSLPVERKGLKLGFTAPTAGHSVKPDELYERAMQASPGPRLEMFARKPRDGFTVWGNEIADAA